MRIAVLEDDPDQANLLKLWLEGAKHNCHIFQQASEFTRELRRGSFDLLILDWELPVSSGIEVLKWVRESADWEIPVLFVTVRDNEEDIVYALEQGADDYMVKPLTRTVTLARIHALARRASTRVSEVQTVEVGEFQINPNDGSITRSGEPTNLTEREEKLAVMLLSNVGRLITRDHLLESVWGITTKVATRTVDTHVSRLRQKLKLTPKNGWQLKAIYQHGYRLERLSQ